MTRWRSWRGRCGCCAVASDGWASAGAGGRRAGRVGRHVVFIRLCAPRIRARATPRSVARQELPHQRSPKLVVATSDLCRATMHGAAQAFGRARAISASKSVSLKKTKSVRFKISFEKMLKLKKKSGQTTMTTGWPGGQTLVPRDELGAVEPFQAAGASPVERRRGHSMRGQR